MAPPAAGPAGPLRPTAPGESPPLVEGPVPLNDVGPPAVPLGLPLCANAKVPDSANADASRIVASFMAVSFFCWVRTANRKGGKQCDVDRTHRWEPMGRSLRPSMQKRHIEDS